MTSGSQTQVVDVETCIRDRLRPAAGVRYRIRVGNDRLEFRELEIGDPAPTARQVLEAAGIRSAIDHLIFAVVENGTPVEVRLDEAVDLIQRRVDRFIVFEGDRSYRFLLDDRRIEWGAGAIWGYVLKTLAGVDLGTHGVWIERRDQPDRLIADDEHVSLEAEAVERFRTGSLVTLCVEGRIHVWHKDVVTTEELAELGGWNPADGVIEVAEDQIERQLAPGETVALKPGVTFGKKLKWRRGTA